MYAVSSDDLPPPYCLCKPWRLELVPQSSFTKTARTRAALAYVDKLTRAPHDITDIEFEPLRKHFSEPEIVDIHLLTGLANLTNRFTDPLGLEVEFPEEKI